MCIGNPIFSKNYQQGIQALIKPQNPLGVPTLPVPRTTQYRLQMHYGLACFYDGIYKIKGEGSKLNI
jgi:hypothetical protein